MVDPRRAGLWLAAGLVSYALVTAPRPAAAGTRHFLSLLENAAHNLIVFVDHLAVSG